LLKTLIQIVTVECEENTCQSDQGMCQFLNLSSNSIHCLLFNTFLDSNPNGSAMRCKECQSNENFLLRNYTLRKILELKDESKSNSNLMEQSLPK
jgi:hypothetical protein